MIGYWQSGQMRRPIATAGNRKFFCVREERVNLVVATIRFLGHARTLDVSIEKSHRCARPVFMRIPRVWFLTMAHAVVMKSFDYIGRNLRCKRILLVQI